MQSFLHSDARCVQLGIIRTAGRFLDIGVRDSASQVGGFGKTPGVSTFCAKKSFPSCRPSRPCRETLQVCDPWTAEPSRQKTPVQTMGNSLWHHDTRQKLMRFCLAPFPSKIRWWEGGATSDAKWDFPLLPIHTPIYSHLSFFFPPFLTPPLPPVEFLCSHETIAQRCDSSFSVRVAQLVVSVLIGTLTSHASLESYQPQTHLPSQRAQHTCDTCLTVHHHHHPPISLPVRPPDHYHHFFKAPRTLSPPSLSFFPFLPPCPSSFSLLLTFQHFPALSETLPVLRPGYQDTSAGHFPESPGDPLSPEVPLPEEHSHREHRAFQFFFLFMICVTLVVRLFVQGVLLFFRVFFSSSGVFSVSLFLL